MNVGIPPRALYVFMGWVGTTFVLDRYGGRIVSGRFPRKVSGRVKSLDGTQRPYRRLPLPAMKLRSLGHLPAHGLIVTMRTWATPAEFVWALGRMSQCDPTFRFLYFLTVITPCWSEITGAPKRGRGLPRCNRTPLFEVYKGILCTRLYHVSREVSFTRNRPMASTLEFRGVR